jgi:two-component system sensor histidine kinase MtrB
VHPIDAVGDRFTRMAPARRGASPATLATVRRSEVTRRRWRIGHRARATVTFAVVAAVVSTALGVVVYSVSRSYLTDQRESAVRDRAFQNARTTRDQLRAPRADPGEVLGTLAPEDGAAALVRVDDEWYSSSVAIEADDLPRDALAEAETGVAAWQAYGRRGVAHIAVVVPLPAAEAIYAEVVPLGELERTLSTLGLALLVGAGATTIAGAALGFVAAGRLVRPLRRLTEQAELVAAGNVGGLDVVADDPDLAPLVRSLNSLIDGASQRTAQGARFVSDVSHEIRAPLAALSAATAVMQRRRAQLPSRSAEALDLLTEQIEEFQKIVLDLLEISRFDAGRAELVLEPTSCEDLARHASALVLSDADLTIRVAEDVPPIVMLDRRRMAQVLVNLLENARRYAGGATEVSVSRPSERIIAFAVGDRGPGVPPAEHTRIFGRFERGEHGQRGPNGSGLGLSLVAEHVALHGGRVFIERPADGGARFVVEVPLCEPD